MDNQYKMNYTLDLARINKQDAVTEYGIGEDMQPTILGWTDEMLVAVATLPKRLPQPRRLEAMIMAVVAMNRNSGITGITLAIDAFLALDAEPVDKDILQRFADGDPIVKEALLILSVLPDDPAYFIAAPYSQLIGRIVEMTGALHRISISDESAYIAPIRQAISERGGTPLLLAELDQVGIQIVYL